MQLAALAKEIPLKSSAFKNVGDVRMYRQDGRFKYTAGNVKTLEEAQKLLESIRAKGFRDAFIVAFRKDERIPLPEAKKLLGYQ